jgi:hypothetical protein
MVSAGVRVDGEQADEGDHRDGGDILEQQHRETEPAMAMFQFALFLQHLQNHRGG